ncbi:f-box wd-repeat pof10, partial [Fusarium pseudocircinatum]
RINKLPNCFNTLAPASQTVQISCARSASFSPEFHAFSYMQQEPLENTEHLIHRDNPYKTTISQHGPLHHDPRGLLRVYSGDSSGTEPGSAPALRYASGHDVDADLLDEELRRLSLGHRSTLRPSAPGQRISEYENAMTPPTPKKALGFKVIKRSETPSDGVQLEDFPNEILTHILSHLHSDSHAAIALVSKRFYALITSSHAWRMAFLRFFPGHEALEIKKNVDMWAHSSHDLIQSESRYFTRLTPMASWRKEYLLRTRLIRSLARGKPGASFASGGIGASVRTGKKTSAVLTYNSKLPWAVTNIHAVFTNGKKPPKAIHGAADLGVASVSDPTNGRVEKWGFVDPFSSMQLDEVFPNLVPFGLGEGPTATPNVLDVSQPYGVLAGEGFPGGRPYYRPVNENRGRYLGADSGVVDTYPDIPKIPEMSEAICSVWLAKSSNVPTNTQSMIGMLTGSTLGVVTSYTLGTDSGPQRYQPGEVTARWVLSPGVPIISLKVDDNYSQKRKSSARVWIVALNALGEVFYLTETPTAQNATKSEDITKNAWFAGRSVYWHLLNSTRRVARPDDSDKNAIKGAYSPRSPSNSMSLSKSQLAAEAREIEKFLRQKSAHFRRVCEGWDMQRKLEVDFANDDGHGAGENIFVIDCGLAENRPAHIQRYTRSLVPQDTQSSSVVLAPMPPDVSVSVQPSLFGTTAAEVSQGPDGKIFQCVTSTSVSSLDVMSHLHEWESCSFRLKGQSHAVITSASMDQSSTSVLTLSEDPLHSAEEEIPGRRSRLLAVGTDDGAVLVWNAREDAKATGISPVRQIQTDSPEVSCVALSAMYVVHGGSDGLVQAWDPLASTLDPVRTLNARSNGRVPRHMVTMNPTLDESTYSAVGAIYLDPDPTVLRGVVSFGAFLRYWAYSSASHASGRKRRLRHSDVHGRLASRRQGGAVIDFIAAEEAEIKRENEQKAREQNRLRSRFGVGALGDLTEEEALRYAQMVSEEAFLFEEQRRTSDSAADASLDTASTFSETTTVDTVTPEPSVSDMITPPSASTDKVELVPVEDDYEQQIQQAVRLSLMEGVNDNSPSPNAASSGDYEFSLTYKPKSGRKNKPSGTVSPGFSKAGSSNNIESRDYDLELALKLSMEEQGLSTFDSSPDIQRDEFPALETEGVGKGKGVQRW